MNEAQVGATQQWLLVHVGHLNVLIDGLLCPNCAGSGLVINIDPQNYGFCSSLSLECRLCERDKKYRRSVYTSSRLQEESRNDVAFDVNVRMVVWWQKISFNFKLTRGMTRE